MESEAMKQNTQCQRGYKNI